MTRKTSSIKPRSENLESKILVKYAFELSRQLGISKMLVFAESVADQRLVDLHRESESIIWLKSKKGRFIKESSPETSVIELPQQELSRTDQFLLGLLLAVLKAYVEVDETVVCLTGMVGSLRLDNLLITNLKRDNKWFQRHEYTKLPKGLLHSREFFQLLDIALRFAEQGREGKPIGTAFILGDPTVLSPYLKQLILNPLEGHNKQLRNIHNSEFTETLREFSALDGAFLISLLGVAERAGVYLDPPPNTKRMRTPTGYGARHTSAALLTAACNAIAIVVSESSSSVTVFYEGSSILEINKP